MTPSDLSKVEAKLPLSEATRRRNQICAGGESQAAGTKAATGGRSQAGETSPTGSSIKTHPGSDRPTRAPLSAEDKLNKTERAYLAILRNKPCVNQVRPQAIRLELATRCCYTPDFSAWVDHGVVRVLTFFEVKGPFIRDDAIVKLKTASRLYVEFDFYLCQWKNNQWTETLMPK